MKPPSLGFIYLVAVVLSTVSFFYWVDSVPWYEESGDSIEGRRKEARYLERIAERTESPAKKAEWLKEAIEIRIDLGEKESAVRLSEKLSTLPEELQEGAWKFRFYSLLDLNAEAYQEALSLFERGERSDHILAAMADRLVSLPHDPSFKRLLEAFRESDSLAEIQGGAGNAHGFAISEDGWTRGSEPGFLILRNGGMSPLSRTLKLACHASSSDLPIAVAVRDGSSKLKGVFPDEQRNVIRFPIDPIEPGVERLVRIQADKAWTPGGWDRRKLGVRVFVEQ